MMSYEERTRNILKKAQTGKRARARRTTVLTSVCSCLLIVLFVLFVPYDTSPPTLWQYQNSEYYDVMQAVNVLTYCSPVYKNNFEAWILKPIRLSGTLKPDSWTEGAVDVVIPTYPTSPDSGSQESSGTPGIYEEVTDNQVDGVIESDRIKRSDRYIFYLGMGGFGRISAYSIAGVDSECIAVYDYKDGENESFDFLNAELYLSADCRTLTVLANGKRTVEEETRFMTMLLSLDVSDPAQGITEKGRVYLSGHYSSSRLTEEGLIVMTTVQLYASRVDFKDPTTFVPFYEHDGVITTVPGENILVPETVGRCSYTALWLLDSEGEEISSSAAVLSCLETVYVSEGKIFVTESTSTVETLDDGNEIQRDATEIAAVSYAGGRFECLGSFTVDGTVKNQYSMDERNGVLRVATSVREIGLRMKYDALGNATSSRVTSIRRYCNLYCIDLATLTEIGAVKGFAPDETVESVRFDGDKAYVCTAVVIEMTDPVFVFDLSDPANITWKDTGTIDGYSSSLVQLGDGLLLGIGVNGLGDLKVEIYKEEAELLLPYDSYERDCGFSVEYKSYLIDRENRYFGIPISEQTGGRFASRYLLLSFDGERLCEVVVLDADGYVGRTRAVLTGGYLYLFSDEGFSVTAIGATE